MSVFEDGYLPFSWVASCFDMIEHLDGILIA
jgi:hypothetical protein